MTASDANRWLRTLLEDIAVAAAVAPHVRHELLADVLAPLGDADADRHAKTIEWHANELLYGVPRQTGADGGLVAALDEAARLAAGALAGVTG